MQAQEPIVDGCKLSTRLKGNKESKDIKCHNVIRHAGVYSKNLVSGAIVMTEYSYCIRCHWFIKLRTLGRFIMRIYR